MMLDDMSETETWIKENVETRKELHRARRFRKCPERSARFDNLSKGQVSPSTKARWLAKLNIIRHLTNILPIETVVVEDVKAETRKNGKKWNSCFSPLEAEKQWFCSELGQLGVKPVVKEGHGTKELPDQNKLIECKQKDKAVFQSHAVDAWALAASVTGAESPIWRGLFYWTPIRLFRRKLHALQPSSGGEHRPYGGKRRMGLTKGTLVRHAKHGLTYVSGALKSRVSLHRLSDGKRLKQNARVENLDVLTTIHWRARLLPTLSGGVSAAHD